MRAKLTAVRTELILLGLTAVFLGVLWGVSTGKNASPEPVAVTTAQGLPPEEIRADPVNLNTADVSELAGLPGIGQGLAQRIIDYRAEHGPFESPEDIMEVSGIGEKKYEGLREYVTVGNENEGAEP